MQFHGGIGNETILMWAVIAGAFVGMVLGLILVDISRWFKKKELVEPAPGEVKELMLMGLICAAPAIITIAVFYFSETRAIQDRELITAEIMAKAKSPIPYFGLGLVSLGLAFGLFSTSWYKFIDGIRYRRKQRKAAKADEESEI
jgi:ABC-type arginine transport system permease subunit